MKDIRILIDIIKGGGDIVTYSQINNELPGNRTETDTHLKMATLLSENLSVNLSVDFKDS